MAWRRPQTEQVVDVRRGSTLTCRISAFHALYSSMLFRAAHRWSDICLENILDLSIPATLRSSVAIPP